MHSFWTEKVRREKSLVWLAQVGEVECYAAGEVVRNLFITLCYQRQRLLVWLH